MPSLESLIPEIEAYQQARSRGIAEQGAGLQQVGALQQILQGPLRAQLLQAQIAEHQQAPDLKRAQMANTLEIAKNRLAAAAQQHEQVMAQRRAQLDQVILTDANKDQVARARLALDAWDKQQKNAIQTELLSLTGQKGTYDYGARPPELPNFGPAPGLPASAAAAPQPSVAPTPAPAPAGPTYAPQVPEGEAPQTIAPTLADAIAKFRSGTGQPLTVAYGPLASQVPQEDKGAPPAFPSYSGYIPTQNPDTELRRFGNQGPQIDPRAAPVAATTSATPAGTQKPPEYLNWPQKKRDEYDARVAAAQAAAQTKQSYAGSAPITPETATRIAQQALNGDSTALSQMGRNQNNIAMVQNEITRLAAAQGVSGADIVGNKAQNQANRVALSAVTKDLAAITPFKEMLDQNAKIAIDLGRKIADDKTNSAFINKPLIWLKNNMSDRPDIAEYLAQMHFIEVEAARVLTQPRLVGQLTDQAIKDMKSVVSGNMTVASTEAVINRILADGRNRVNAMQTQQQRILSEIRGGQPRTRATDSTGVDTSNPLLR